MGNLTSNNALIVDLSSGEAEEEALEDEFYQEHLGGAAANVALYNRYRDDDPLIFGTGLLTGTLFPGSALGMMTAKSPRTGKLCHAPFCLYGGTELKYTGFDFVVVKGASEQPVYLWLHDQVANINDASSLWGMDTWGTTEELRRALGEDLIQVLSIGEAGETGSGVAEINLNYWPIGDRWGFGQILGMKKVKAIALRGLGIFDLISPDEFVKDSLDLHSTIRSGPMSGYRGNIEFPDYLGDGAVKSWVQPLVHRSKACFGCPYPCNTFLKYNEDPSIIQETEVDEPGFLVTDVAALLALNRATLTPDVAGKVLELCSRHGVDALAVASRIQSTGATSFDDIKEGFSGIVGGIDPTQVSPWSANIPEAKAELAGKTFSTWSPPKPLFADVELDGGEDGTVDWWYRRNALAYVAGICPIFTLMAPELDEERVIGALKLGTDLELSVDDLDKACRSLLG